MKPRRSALSYRQMRVVVKIANLSAGFARSRILADASREYREQRGRYVSDEYFRERTKHQLGSRRMIDPKLRNAKNRVCMRVPREERCEGKEIGQECRKI